MTDKTDREAQESAARKRAQEVVALHPNILDSFVRTECTMAVRALGLNPTDPLFRAVYTDCWYALFGVLLNGEGDDLWDQAIEKAVHAGHAAATRICPSWSQQSAMQARLDLAYGRAIQHAKVFYREFVATLMPERVQMDPKASEDTRESVS